MSKGITEVKNDIKKMKRVDWFEIVVLLLWEGLMFYGVIIGSSSNGDKIFLLGIIGMVIGFVVNNQRRISKIEEKLKEK